MQKSTRKFEDAKFERARMPVLALLVVGLVVLLAALTPTPAHAVRPWYDMYCLEEPVTEGDSFELWVTNNSWGGYVSETVAQPFELYWRTTPITADDHDYTALRHEKQVGTYHETWGIRRMSRTFHTTEDDVSEDTEKYRVSFTYVGQSYGTTACTITIEDDDGPGAKEIWVASTPKEAGGYTVGETITFKQQFTEAVEVHGDDLSIEFGLGEKYYGTTRDADYVSGSGTDILTYEYDIHWGDVDDDGIDVTSGTIEGDGTIVTLASGAEVNYNYQGIGNVPDQKVSGRPYVTGVEVSSAPAGGDIYRKDEAIDVSVNFSRDVEVEGNVFLKVQVGQDKDRPVNFHYNRGSGTDTLVFQHVVNIDDYDPDGLVVDNGNAGVPGYNLGFGGSGNINEADGELHAFTEYEGLPVQPEHKVDGRPYVKGISVASSPPNGVSYRFGEYIDIALQFDQVVMVQNLPYVPLWIGTDTAGRREEAKYISGSMSDMVTFRYHIEENDLDIDGVSVPERIGFIGDGKMMIPDTDREMNHFIPELEAQSGHTVDGSIPFIENAAITSAPAQGDTYRLGEAVEVSLTFDKEVEVLGQPTIRLELGDGENRRDATYDRGDGTKTLVFAYTVLATDVDRDGVALTAMESQGIDGPYRVYEAGTENEVVATITGAASLDGHKVDGSPYVTTAAIDSTPSSGETYLAGETIQVSLTFDRAVDVKGDPTVKLVIGDNERHAEYREGTGTSILVLEYEVQHGDFDTDGVTITEDGLSPNSGSIEDESDIGASVSYEGVTADDQLVDAVMPALVGAATSTDGGEVTLTFSEAVHVSEQLRTLSTFAGVDAGVYLQVVIDVFADGHRMHTSGARVSGTDLTLALDTALLSGQEVTVSYDNIFTTDLPDLLEDNAGNALAAFAAQSVTNNSTLADDSNFLWPVLSANSLIMAEGSSATYTVALDSKPDEDVTISLAVNPGSHLAASPSELNFTPENWDTAQEVTLTAETDASDQRFWQEIIHTSGAAGFVAGHVKVLTEDNG